jgi:hypothetical protein
MMEELTRTDRDALRRALAAAREESEMYRDHLAGIEAREGWLAAAESSSYHLQVRNLRLRPWQCPPCDCRSDEVGHGYGRSRGEVLLRKRMLEAGISLYEADPAVALEKIASGVAGTSVA